MIHAMSILHADPTPTRAQGHLMTFSINFLAIKGPVRGDGMPRSTNL